jgi:cysteine sulfinate desulfinase/cysteine desulfurase-like protein
MHGSVRFSLGRSTDRQAIDRVMEVFPDIVARLSHMSALTAQV